MIEANYTLLETLIREKQKVEHERDREVMNVDYNCSFDKHESSDTDDNDEGLSDMSGLSAILGKTAFRLIEIIRMYFDTSLKTSTIIESRWAV